VGRIGWRGKVGMFDVEERLAGLSKKGDDLERLAAVIEFELFRPELERAVPRADRSKGGRPPFDHVLMFKVLILQTQNNPSDERTECYVGDRLSWMRFLGLGLGDAVPDANTIWIPRSSDQGGRHRAAVRAVRPGAARGGLPRDVRAADRREHRRGTQAAQHPSRKAGDQGRPRAGGLAGQAGEAPPKGPRRALDGQDDQGQTAPAHVAELAPSQASGDGCRVRARHPDRRLLGNRVRGLFSAS
jgi:Transposase domain (DUF772)